MKKGDAKSHDKSHVKVTAPKEVSNATEVRELIREQYLDQQKSYRNSLTTKPSKFRSRVRLNRNGGD